MIVAASIASVRFAVGDSTPPYTFPDEVIQDALDAAADFLFKRYQGQGSCLTLYPSNDPSILMPATTGGIVYSSTSWADYWLSNAYVINIDDPTGKKIQRMMATADLISQMLVPNPNRNPTGVSEGGLSIQWGGSYEQALEILNKQIESELFKLEAPMFVMYDNY